MFKLWIKLMALLVVLALAAPFILKRPDGRPLMTLDRLHLPSMPTLPSMAELTSRIGVTGPTAQETPEATRVDSDGDHGMDTGLGTAEGFSSSKAFMPDPAHPVAPQPGVFYRYRDQNGSWTWSDRPQAGITNYRVVTDASANVIQSIDRSGIDSALGRNPAEPTTRTDKKVAIAGGENEKEETSLLDKIGLTTVPLKELPGLIQQAKDVRAQTEQREQALRNLGAE
jgi:hypothetical protein